MDRGGHPCRSARRFGLSVYFVCLPLLRHHRDTSWHSTAGAVNERHDKQRRTVSPSPVQPDAHCYVFPAPAHCVFALLLRYLRRLAIRLPKVLRRTPQVLDSPQHRGRHSFRCSCPLAYLWMATLIPIAATPNHALQRTGSAVTAPAADHLRLSAHRQVPRPLRLSLSLGALGDSARL